MIEAVEHDNATRVWGAALAGGRLHHAWLLHGPEGVGKAYFANQAARQLLGDSRQTDADALHPDLHWLARAPANEIELQKQQDGKPFQTRRNITVDQIRGLLRRLTTRPSQGDFRAIIINSADDLERSAANALLKALEEPPVGSVFFLISHRPGRLLPTIRSRCRSLGFDPPGRTALETIVRAQAMHESASDIDIALSLGGGTAGGSLAVMQHGLAKSAAIMQDIALAGDPHRKLRSAFVESVGSKPAREAIDLILAIASRLAAQAAITMAGAQRMQAIETQSNLAKLQLYAPTANFDIAALLTQIGNLLASMHGTKGQG